MIERVSKNYAVCRQASSAGEEPIGLVTVTFPGVAITLGHLLMLREDQGIVSALHVNEGYTLREVDLREDGTVVPL